MCTLRHSAAALCVVLGLALAACDHDKSRTVVDGGASAPDDDASTTDDPSTDDPATDASTTDDPTDGDAATDPDGGVTDDASPGARLLGADLLAPGDTLEADLRLPAEAIFPG